jgi:hypothetical protein
MATQKLGIDCPNTAMTRMPTSQTEPRFKAAAMPRCPFHKFAASQAAARLYGLGGYKARSNR